MESVDALDTRDGRGAGPQHTNALRGRFLKPVTKLAGPGNCFLKLFRLDEKICESAERWIVHPAAIFHLAIYKGCVVVRACGEDCVVVGIVRLNDDAAAERSATGAA